jgi:hypothetical protein
MSRAIDAAHVAERRRFADWLATELCYPFDVSFVEPPPVSPRDVAEAHMRLERREAEARGSDDVMVVDDWLRAMRDELGAAAFDAWEARA